MIIDNHYHLIEEETPPERIIELMNEAGVDKVVLLANASERLPVPRALLWLARNILQTPFANVGRAIAEGTVREKPGYIKVKGRFFKIYKYPDNKPVAEAISRFPDRFLGFVFLNPKDNPKVLEELERGIEEYGMCGVKTNPWWHDYNPSVELLPVAKRCEELGIPLLIHLGSNPETGDIQGLLDECPKLNIILAHLGIPWFKRSWRQAREHPNLYLDISGPFLSARIVRRALKAVGPEKLIYGTDGPYGLRLRREGHSYKPSLRWVEGLPISEEEKEKIFSKNLLGILPSGK